MAYIRKARGDGLEQPSVVLRDPTHYREDRWQPLVELDDPLHDEAPGRVAVARGDGARLRYRVADDGRHVAAQINLSAVADGMPPIGHRRRHAPYQPSPTACHLSGIADSAGIGLYRQNSTVATKDSPKITLCIHMSTH